MTKKVQRFTTSTYRPLSEPGAEVLVGTTRLKFKAYQYIYSILIPTPYIVRKKIMAANRTSQPINSQNIKPH